MGRGHAVVLLKCFGVDVVLEKKRKVKTEDRAPDEVLEKKRKKKSKDRDKGKVWRRKKRGKKKRKGTCG